MLVSNTSDVHSVIFGVDVQFDNQASWRFLGDFGRSVIFVRPSSSVLSLCLLFLLRLLSLFSAFSPKKDKKPTCTIKNQPCM